MGLKIGGKVEKVNGKELTYADFVGKYLDQNQPVILTGLTDVWRACKDWVSDDGKPNLRFFSDYFGGSRVQLRIVLRGNLLIKGEWKCRFPNSSTIGSIFGVLMMAGPMESGCYI